MSCFLLFLSSPGFSFDFEWTLSENLYEVPSKTKASTVADFLNTPFISFSRLALYEKPMSKSPEG